MFGGLQFGFRLMPVFAAMSLLPSSSDVNVVRPVSNGVVRRRGGAATVARVGMGSLGGVNLGGN
jgi:hypothetical protein